MSTGKLPCVPSLRGMSSLQYLQGCRLRPSADWSSLKLISAAEHLLMPVMLPGAGLLQADVPCSRLHHLSSRATCVAGPWLHGKLWGQDFMQCLMCGKASADSRSLLSDAQELGDQASLSLASAWVS